MKNMKKAFKNYKKRAFQQGKPYVYIGINFETEKERNRYEQ